jgi:Tol biopolymer transport system component/DNA-binding winged helix-turn-helix (wHTH) protein
MSSLSGHIHRFNDFAIDIEQRVLLRGGKPISLAPKVFETLLALVENHGRIVLKEELMKRLWPDTFVEESNLTFNVQQLRKALGDNARKPVYIETIPRRGYRFIAEVEPLWTDQREVDATALSQNQTEPSTLFTTPQPVAPNSARVVAILTVIGVAIAAIGLVSWSLARRGGSSSIPNNGNAASAKGLKLVELTATGQSRLVAISPDGKYVAYTHGSQNSVGIWVRQLASNTNVEIVTANRIAGLEFANNGESLYFVKGEPSALYRVSLIGGVQTKLIDTLEGNFSVSPDDSQIAFIRQVINREGQREYSLLVAGSDGHNERTLLVRSHPGKLDVPLWSPDGQSIICAHGNSAAGSQDVSLVAINVNTGEKKDLSSFRFFLITKMDWLPDRSGLIISARKNMGVDNQLFRVSYPTMEISQITEGLNSYADLSVAANADYAAASQSILESHIWIGSSRDPQNLKRITQALNNFCWTPDGRIVYSTTASGSTDIWIMQPDGKEQKQLTVNSGINGSPAMSPSDEYIVFVSNRTGSFQIWRMNLDGSNQTQLTHDSAKNYPAMSPDGKWVLFNSIDDWHLWKISIDGGEPVQLTDFFASTPSISADGKMIACIGRNELKRQLFILPFDGGPPIKKLEFFGWISRIQWMNDDKALMYAGERDGRRAIMRQSLNGDLTEQPLNLDTDELFDFGYSADGRSLAITRGAWLNDIVLISGLNQY